MLIVNKNTTIDKHLIVTVPLNPFYILVLQDSRGVKHAFNLVMADNTKRFVRILFKKTHINSLTKGEYKYYIYFASNQNDLNYSGKTAVKKGILMII